jgi:hypothetical protein
MPTYPEGVTSDRAQAYGRVVQLLDELGPTKLNPAEQERIRTAADTLLFAEDPVDEGAHRALDDIDELAQHLTGSGRWTDERARRLVDDVTACGPLAPVA